MYEELQSMSSLKSERGQEEDRLPHKEDDIRAPPNESITF